MRATVVCVTVAACNSAKRDDVVRIESHGLSFIMPDTIPAGLVHLRLVNHGPEVHESVVVHFLGSAGSAAAYADSIRADVDFPGFAEDYAGPGLTPPGDSSDAWLDLAAGRYAVVCFMADHLERGMVRDFVVGGARAPSAATAPAPTVVITMRNYAFTVPPVIAAGPQMVQLRNEGTEVHEADILRLADGVTLEKYLAWLDGGERGPSPGVPTGGGSMVPGRDVTFPMTLRPGRYAIICTVPQKGTGTPHRRLGMLGAFEVRGS